jgi:putative hemolysin
MDWINCDRLPGESVFDGALRKLQVSPTILSGQEDLDRVPHEGGLLIVANHPYGVIDGLALGHLGMLLRGNVHILASSLLCRVPEIEPHLLPVDFASTAKARRLTAESRRKATELLDQGKVVAIFPAGGVATANRPFFGPAMDSAWHPFVGRLASVIGTTVLPVHIAGENSRLFQIASHTSYPLRVALIFNETRRRLGLPIHLSIGKPISAECFSASDRDSIAAELRRRCMALAGPTLADPDEQFVWPSYIRW